MQARYGWTDEYVLYNLPYARFVKKAGIVVERKKEEMERQRERDLFLGWQVNIAQPRGEGDKPPLFKKYCKNLGFKELAYRNTKIDKEEKEMEKRKAYENQKDVIDFVKRKQEG